MTYKTIIPIILGFIVSAAFCHPRGTVNIDISLLPDLVLVELDFNKDDLLYYSQVEQKYHGEMTREESCQLNRKLERALETDPI